MYSTSAKTTTHAIIIIGVGLVALAICVLVWYMKGQRLEARAPAIVITSSFEQQKQAVDTYISSALTIGADLASGAITPEVAKTRALGLVVPAVMKQRHLDLILAIDAKDFHKINELMQEYAILQLTP